MAAIKETKELLDFVLPLGSGIGNSLEDGFQFTDLLSLLPAFVKLPSAMDGLDQIPEELADLDDDELDELKKYVSDKFDLSSDELELIIEEGLYVGVQLLQFAFHVRDLVNKPE